ncbi:MAG: serine/threonine protein kinase [Kangiellaceae bacterium]|nr:serine/threonine protein kinase [Kangiellaceae bacterium]
MSAIEIPGYKIIKTLGVGGQATVYLAIQQGFDREVALKIMSPALAADPTFGERFIREAKIVATLSHSKIVTVYDVGESGSFYYLAMEYMRGEELKSRIAQGMKAKDCLVIIARLAQALHFAHGKGYIHRDVKSENILFNDDDLPVLTDFGIAKASNSSTQMTQTGKLIGTPEYMSPEQCRGRKLDGRSDLYSLGIILFEMLTRKVPFTGEDSVSVCIQHVTKPVPQLPVRLNHFQWLIDSLLAKSPDDRFQSGNELAKAIQSYLTSSVEQKPRRVTGQSRTVISEVIDQPTDDDDVFQNQSFELNDNFEVEQRINVEPEKKSSIGRFTIFAVLVIGSAFGYLQKETWLPQVQQTLGIDWFPGYLVKSDEVVTKKIDTTQQESNPDNIVSSSANEKKNAEVSEREQTVDQRVVLLIKQANTLVDHVPYELTDIQQAMDLLTTAKSLTPNNTEVVGIKNRAVTIALEEAIQAANKNQFDGAEQWVKLVEFTDKDNLSLSQTKQTVSELKLLYEQKESDELTQIKKLSEYLASADEAIVSGKLGTPKDNNAIHFMILASAISPSDPRIEQGFNKIESRYLELINTSVDKRNFAQAEKYFAKINSLPIIQVDKEVLRNKIDSTKKRHDAYRKEQNKLALIEKQNKEQQQKRLTKLADPLVQMRMQSGLQAANELKQAKNLVLPLGNNALEKYRSVLEIDSQNIDALAGIKEIENTIVTSLEVALSNNVKLAAIDWLNKLRVYDPEFVRLSEYQSQYEQLSSISVPIDQNEAQKEAILDSDEAAPTSQSNSEDEELKLRSSPEEGPLETETESKPTDKDPVPDF